MCASRQGQLDTPSWVVQQQQQQQAAAAVQQQGAGGAGASLPQGSGAGAAWWQQQLRVPRYVLQELGPRYVAEMRRPMRNKTYSQVGASHDHMGPLTLHGCETICSFQSFGWVPANVAALSSLTPPSRQAKPKNLTDEQWVDQINDTIIKVAGLDDKVEGGSGVAGGPDAGGGPEGDEGGGEEGYESLGLEGAAMRPSGERPSGRRPTRDPGTASSGGTAAPYGRAPSAAMVVAPGANAGTWQQAAQQLERQQQH